MDVRKMNGMQVLEMGLLHFLARHPDFIGSLDADRAFWVMTDERFRDMYVQAREGRSLREMLTDAGLWAEVAESTDFWAQNPRERLDGIVSLLRRFRASHRSGGAR